MPENIQPLTERSAKILQMLVGGEYVQRYWSIDKKHRDLLAATLREYGIDFVRTHDGFSGVGPELKGESASGLEYEVVGMGQVTRSKDKVALHAISLDYELGVDRDHFEYCLNELGEELEIIVL
tara:strand:+ start:2141 stop:2512 length:372 start_codon:yes stop_codon:yes gene_type:complete